MPLPLQLRMAGLETSRPAAEGGEALCDVPDGAGDPGQRVSAVDALPRLMSSDPAGCLAEVVPRVTQSLPVSPPEFQRAASASFLAVLQRELLPQSTFTQTFLQSILISVDSKDPAVAGAWLETLLDVIDLLPADIIQQEILGVAVEKSQLSHTAASRVAGCKLIGKMASKFDPYTIQTELLASVQSLCQDVDCEVRAAMCAQLGPVARGLGPQETRAAIIPELVELASDEEVTVRLAAFRTLVEMLDILDDETCTQTIIPLATKVCESSYEARDSSLPVIARLLGRLCAGLNEYLSVEQKQTFLDFYGNVARLKNLHKAAAARNELNPMPDLVPQLDPSERYRECCEACAFNFPAMLLLAEGDLSRANLHATFTDLVFDPHPPVRRLVAAGFHEVCRLLGASVRQVHSELVHLLKDDNVDVLAAVVERLPLTLSTFVRHGVLGPSAKPELVAELTAALMTCECVIANTTRWRLHAGLLDRLSSLADCFPPDHLYHCWVPTVLQKLHTVRPVPCRQAAAGTLLVFLQHVRQIEHRNIICARIVEELGQSDSCHMRKLYLDICALVLDMFSKAYFKQYFFSTALALVDDPVPNIRRGLCLLLARMKATLRLPADKRRLQQLEAVVRQLLISEQDRDAAAAVRTAIIQLDKIEVAMETPSRPSLVLEADVEDRRRQRQEQLQLEPSPSAQQPRSGTDERRLSRGGRIPVRTGAAAGASTPPPARNKSRSTVTPTGAAARWRPSGSQRGGGGSGRRHSLAESAECRIPSLARLRVRDTLSEPELPPPPSPGARGSPARGRLGPAARGAPVWPELSPEEEDDEEEPWQPAPPAAWTRLRQPLSQLLSRYRLSQPVSGAVSGGQVASSVGRFLERQTSRVLSCATNTWPPLPSRLPQLAGDGRAGTQPRPSFDHVLLAGISSVRSRLHGCRAAALRQYDRSASYPATAATLSGAHSSHGSAVHSLENLDSTADEFYIDAGIRIPPAHLRQLDRSVAEPLPPPPPASPPATPRTSRLRPPTIYGRTASAELAPRPEPPGTPPRRGWRRPGVRRPASTYLGGGGGGCQSGVSSTQSSPGGSRAASPDGRSSPALSRIPLRSSLGAGSGGSSSTSSLPAVLSRARWRRK